MSKAIKPKRRTLRRRRRPALCKGVTAIFTEAKQALLEHVQSCKKCSEMAAKRAAAGSLERLIYDEDGMFR